MSIEQASDLLAMDKAMARYIEFQSQFGGQLADAVPTEEFEALQACLSSADYDGALEVARRRRTDRDSSTHAPMRE